MLFRKAAAIPLLLIGGALWLAVMLATVAAGIYFNVEMVKALFDGDFVAALIGIPIVNGIVIMVASVLQVPGSLLLAAGHALSAKA